MFGGAGRGDRTLNRWLRRKQAAACGCSLLALLGGLSARVYAQSPPETRPALATAAALDVQANFGFQYDDNVTRSGVSADQLSDQVFSVDVSKRWVFPLHANTRALVTFNLGGEKFGRFNGLSRLTGGVQGAVQYRASAAFDAPTFAIFGRMAAD